MLKWKPLSSKRVDRQHKLIKHLPSYSSSEKSPSSRQQHFLLFHNSSGQALILHPHVRCKTQYRQIKCFLRFGDASGLISFLFFWPFSGQESFLQQLNYSFSAPELTSICNMLSWTGTVHITCSIMLCITDGNCHIMHKIFPWHWGGIWTTAISDIY